MNINDAFPSKYISTADLQGRDHSLKIVSVVLEDLDGDHKPIAYFEGRQKGLVVNKTNFEDISTMFGLDTSTWIGNTIVLWGDPSIMYAGKRVGGIRVRMQATVPVLFVAPSPQPSVPSPGADQAGAIENTLDDELPF